MKATMNPTKMEARIKQKLRTLIGNVTHMQNVADQTLELIKSILTEDERLGHLPRRREPVVRVRGGITGVVRGTEKGNPALRDSERRRNANQSH